jgi:hypothetical protein
VWAPGLESETLARISEFPFPWVLKLSPYLSISSLRSKVKGVSTYKEAYGERRID